MEAQAQQNLETVRAVYKAYETRDVEGLLGLLDDEFEVYHSELLPWGGRYKGRDGMMQYIMGIAGYVESGVAVEELYSAGDDVIMVGRSHGTVKSTGEPYEVRLVDVIRVRDGKLQSLDIYTDTPAFLEALALES